MSYYSLVCTLVCISVLTFSIISCGSSRKDAARNTDSKSTDTAQLTPMQADTVPDRPPPPEPAPAPGTLRLQGKIIKIQSEGDNSSAIYEIKVLKTLGMGAGTPAVVSKDTIKVASSKKSPEITEAMNVICLIRHKRSMAQHQDSTASWQLLQWESNTNKDK